MATKCKGKKLNIPMLVACVLLCLTMVSMHMTSGLYSRYVATGDGADSARVITFGEITLEETGDFILDEYGKPTDTLRVIPGADLEKQAKISFEGSESATYVFVAANLGNGWKTTDNRTFTLKSDDVELVSWSVADDWAYVSGTVSPYVYYKALDPNTLLEKSAFFKAIDSAGNTIKVSQYITSTELGGLSIPVISIQAKAVQSNGFANVAEAWNSVKSK